MPAIPFEASHRSPSAEAPSEGARARPRPATPPSPGQAFALLGLWVFATAFNLTKAFHIDDTAYLEVARWIAANPLHPMRGEVFWGATPQGIDAINQPHLYFYLMAGWGSVFGWSEVAIHALLAIFTLLATWFAFRLARTVAPRWALASTALIVASPAFVVGQNTMVDVPLLCLWLAFFVLLIDADAVRTWKRSTLIGVVCGAAILVKYTSLVLFAILLLDTLVCRRRTQWASIGAALAIVAAWSAFNWWDYGSVHVLGRKDPTAWQVLDPGKWLLALGATMPCAALLGYAWLSRSSGPWARGARLLAIGLGASVLLLLALSLSRSIDEEAADLWFAVSFLACGAVMVAMAMASAWQSRREMSRDRRACSILIAWAGGVIAFTLLLAPFIATRHVLLALPPIVMLVMRMIPERSPRTTVAGAVAVNVLLTAVVASADSWYAGIYRDMARELRAELPADAKVWTVGHWGWQWYATQNGMTPFGPADGPRIGDYFVYPETVDRQPLPKDVAIAKLRVTEVSPASLVEAFASRNAGFYATSAYAQLPWAVRHTPIERFVVGKVTSIEHDQGPGESR